MTGKMRAILAAAAIASGMPPPTARAGAGDEAQIKVLEERFVAAFNAKDVDAIMKVYEPGARLFVFDVTPPRQYVGADAYRKDWQDFFAMFNGPVKFTISDLAVAADRNLAYSHSIQRVTGTEKSGKPIDLTVRLTDAKED
jgi:ketosteroid isomerase-like protein